MKKLLVLVGLQGAGKTTALSHVKNALVLRPSTSRQPRPGEPLTDYHFETDWNANPMAWAIKFGTVDYGMRISELDTISETGITVFEPGNINVLHQKKPSLNFEIITIGLDTMETLQQQNLRVNNDPKRTVKDQAEFDRQRTAVLECDIVLNGDIAVVAAAINAAIRCLSGRGGLIDIQSIKELTAAGTLLKNAKVNQIEAASYDLTLADTYWCQGKYLTVSGNDTINIPAYSFVFVTAQEEACLPRFIGGNFDLTVSMFFDGLILSNGPQVDPGYRGALFCMLYNTSDQIVSLTRNFKFATIQFYTTAFVSPGYTGQYQNKSSFQDFLNRRAAISPGGKILERLNGVEERVEAKFVDLRGEVRTTAAQSRSDMIALCSLVCAIVTAICLGVATYAYFMADKASANADKASAATDKATSVTEKAEASLGKMNSLTSDINSLNERIKFLESTSKVKKPGK